jgi:hypothetical protein
MTQALPTVKLQRITASALANNPRCTLRAWLRYKPVVEAAMATFPRPYIYTPQNLAATSVCTKVRDAIRGALCPEFAYEPEDFRKKLHAWYASIVVKQAGKTVILGPPSRQLTQLSLVGSGDCGSTNSLTFPNLSLPELDAFSLLLSHNRISGPIIVTSPPDITGLVPRPNVEILTPEDGSVVLI